MTIATALLERATANTTTTAIPADVLATVVESPTPQGGHTGPNIPLLVTRTQRMRSYEVDDNSYQPQSWPDLHGTVQMVRGANITYTGWVLPTGESDRVDSIRVFGAPVNPPMVEGHFYRLIETTVRGYLGHIIQFRNAPAEGSRLKIVQRGDGLPVVGEDGWHTWAEDVFCYVEVVDPRAPESIEELVADDDMGLLDFDEPETEVAPVGIPTHLTFTEVPRNIRAYVEYEEGGIGDARTTALNPDPVDGEVYAVWWTNEDGDALSNNPTVAMRVGDRFTHLGEINRWGFDTDSSDMNFAGQVGTMRWVALHAGVESPLETESALTDITAETAQIEARFDGMLTELHAMADRKAWCGEYEEVMHRGDMPGRPRYEVEEEPEPERHAYDIEVRAYFRYSGSQPDSGVDRDLAERWDIEGVDISTIEFTAYREFTISGIEADSEDVARQSIDNDRVLEELNEHLSEIEADEVTSFNIQTVTEDENYDFD